MIISFKYYSEKMNGLLIGMLYAISIYVVFATTIHPWYVIMPLALSMFTNYRYVLVWSSLITLTYINYSYSPYQENLWVVALEYLIVVIFIIIEWRRYKEERWVNNAIPK